MTQRATDLALATVIQNETTAALNTHTRVGAALAALATDVAFTEDLTEAKLRAMAAALTAPLAINGQKVTGAAAGTVAGDMAIFDQIIDAFNFITQDSPTSIDFGCDDFICGGSNGTGAALIVNGDTFGKLGFRAGSSGGGSVTLVMTQQSQNCIGVVQLDPGTVTANASSIALSPAGTIFPMVLGAGQKFIRHWDIIMPVVSDGTNTYTVRLGFGDASTAIPGNGLYFECSLPTNANWLGIGMVASTPTTASGGTNTAPLNSKTRLTLIWDGTTATFKVNGVVIGTTTTVPTGVNLCEFAQNIRVTSGGTARGILIDRYAYVNKFTARAA